MKTTLLLTVEHDKPISDLVDRIAQRAWTIDGVKSEGHKIPGEPGAVVARHLMAFEERAVDEALRSALPK